MLVNNYIKRSISDQTGNFSYLNTFSLSNTTGDFEFGISGLNTINFYFKSGKIYDSDLSFLYGYNANIPVVLSGQIAPTAQDCYIDNYPIYIGKSKATGEFGWIYYNANGVNVDASTQIFGDDPSYIYNLQGTFNSGEYLTGTFVNLNPEIAFRIFSGEVTENSNYFQLISYPSGNITSSANFIIYSSADTTITSNLPLIFYTNFGDLDIQFDLTGATSGTYFFDIIPNTGITLSGNSFQEFNVSYSLPFANEIYYNAFLTGVTGYNISGLYYDNHETGLISGSMATSGDTITESISRQFLYNSGGFNGILDGSGLWTGAIATGSWTGAGFYTATGQGPISGYFPIEEDKRIYLFDLITGFDSGTTYDYLESGFTGYRNYYNNGSLILYPYETQYIKVKFNQFNFVTGLSEICKLYITGSGGYTTGIIIDITGII